MVKLNLLLALLATAQANAASLGWPWSPPPTDRSNVDYPKTCLVKPNGHGKDDAQSILNAMKTCNNGGAVVFQKNNLYTIGSPLDLTFLRDIDIYIDGTIQFTNDIPYWTEHSFKFAYQNGSAFWKFGGSGVNIIGGEEGVIDGQGGNWWTEFQTNSQLQRPVLLLLDGLEKSSVTNLKMIQPPSYFNFVANSSQINYNGLTLNVTPIGDFTPKNTDGWDTYKSDLISIQNSYINNNDDCVSFKPNTTNVIVQNLACNGSHGISVGSLGQYVGEYDIVQNVLVTNVSMSNAQNGARIKAYPGRPAGSTVLDNGGGSGIVENIMFKDFHVDNVDYAIDLTQCYGGSSTIAPEICQQNPADVIIKDIFFVNVTGTTSKKINPYSGELTCSSPNVSISHEDSDIGRQLTN
ncbi:Pgu1p [Sugiyamaella lignohabitans]|uniref:galacturonan 1,4-alpha-galacturonidase n=1 Tax=Sugiyamaella lignohabitans TaxID=796027 RepID=A0A167D1K9_9ASCO|nr:Pgu1p [Sugiyamaella lignohabitans]ANB12369.1 Pgu1p [Sugiyamaella lignohabitans]